MFTIATYAIKIGLGYSGSQNNFKKRMGFYPPFFVKKRHNFTSKDGVIFTSDNNIKLNIIF